MSKFSRMEDSASNRWYNSVRTRWSKSFARSNSKKEEESSPADKFASTVLRISLKIEGRNEKKGDVQTYDRASCRKSAYSFSVTSEFSASLPQSWRRESTRTAWTLTDASLSSIRTRMASIMLDNCFSLNGSHWDMVRHPQIHPSYVSSSMLFMNIERIWQDRRRTILLPALRPSSK